MATPRLRVSPAFVLAFSMDGRPYVAKDTEPYVQYWLTPTYRTLHAQFGDRRGSTADDAIDRYFRVTGARRTAAARRRLTRAIDDMRGAGVLIGTRDDVSRYTSAIVDDYIAHRPFPPAIADHIIRSSGIDSGSRVLDLAGGPGDLALALARVSRDVTLMDLSRAFLDAAARRAVASGVSLTTEHESCNRLVYRDDEFDLITVSQALHWLDDVLVARGVCRLLRPGGRFVVVHASVDVADDHPLARVIGRASVLGAKPDISFADEAAALQRRLTRLFEALDTPDVHRIDLARRDDGARIGAIGTTFFDERRPFDLGYVRGFLTDTHISSAGFDPAAFRRALEADAAAAEPATMVGTMHWAAIEFGRVADTTS